MTLRRRLLSLLVVAATALVVVGLLQAYFTGALAGGSAGAAAATELSEGPTPAVAPGPGGSVDVSWSPGEYENGDPVTGYLVTRYDASSDAPQTTLGDCAGTISSLGCRELSVPVGTWRYGITPVGGTFWRGPEGSLSQPLTVAAATLTLDRQIVAAPLPAELTGTLTGFGAGEPIDFRLDAGTELTGTPAAADPTGNAAVSIALPAGTADGPHTITAVGTGSATPSQAGATVLVDTTPPASRIAGTDGTWHNTAVTATLTADDGPVGSGVDHLTYQLDGGATQTLPGTGGLVTVPAPSDGSGDGSHTLAVRATDVAGNVETPATSATVMIDTQPPVTTLSTSPSAPDGTNGWFKHSSVTFSLSATDAHSGVAAGYYTLDGGQAQPYGGAVTVSGLGTHTIDYWSIDNAGNSEPVHSTELRLDDVPPTTTDSSATIGAGWFNTTQTVLLSPSDGVSGVAGTYYTSDGSTPTTASSSGTSVALAGDGIYTVKYFSVDNAGNQEQVRTAGTAVHIDKTNPTPAALTTAGAYVNGGTTYIRNGQTLTDAATDPTVGGASSGVASVAYLYCTGAGCTPATPIGTSTTGPGYAVVWSSQPADGTYRLQARVTDGAGNTATSAVVTVVVDNTAPTGNITSPLAGANIRGTTTVTSDSTDTGSGVASVKFERSPHGQNTWTQIGTDSSAPWQVSWTTTGVSDGQYDLRATTTDNAGNTYVSPLLTVRVDNTAPSVPTNLAAPSKTSTTVSLTWTASTDSGSGVASYQILRNGVQVGTSATASYTDTGLTPNTSYTYTVKAVDAAGNVSAASSQLVVTTPPTVNVKAQYKNLQSPPAPNDQWIMPGLQLVNTGATSISLNTITIRYWFTGDGGTSFGTSCWWATVGCSAVLTSTSPVSPARSGADTYLQVGFTSGTLGSGATTEVQLGVNKTNWSNFNESDDYSYGTGTSYADWTKVTVYANGILVWGTEP